MLQELLIQKVLYFQALTIALCSKVGKLHISLVAATELSARGITPTLPGEQQLVIIPGLGHDLSQIWETKHKHIKNSL